MWYALPKWGSKSITQRNRSALSANAGGDEKFVALYSGSLSSPAVQHGLMPSDTTFSWQFFPDNYSLARVMAISFLCIILLTFMESLLCASVLGPVLGAGIQ